MTVFSSGYFWVGLFLGVALLYLWIRHQASKTA